MPSLEVAGVFLDADFVLNAKERAGARSALLRDGRPRLTIAEVMADTEKRFAKTLAYLGKS
jgi:hypothetical protein